MIFNEISEVIENKEIAENIFEAHLSSENISKIAKPGQFINILPSDQFNQTMRRPMSLSCQDQDSLKIIWEIVNFLKILGIFKVLKILKILKPVS